MLGRSVLRRGASPRHLVDQMLLSTAPRTHARRREECRRHQKRSVWQCPRGLRSGLMRGHRATCWGISSLPWGGRGELRCWGARAAPPPCFAQLRQEPAPPIRPPAHTPPTVRHGKTDLLLARSQDLDKPIPTHPTPASSRQESRVLERGACRHVPASSREYLQPCAAPASTRPLPLPPL